MATADISTEDQSVKDAGVGIEYDLLFMFHCPFKTAMPNQKDGN